MIHHDIATLRRLLDEADHVCALTGAGVSAESGVPTFRGDGGLWRDHDPTRIATIGAFRRDPALVWEFYNWRRALVRSVAPNRAHLALARLERRVPDFTLITQNVDGLHPAAGSERCIEIHGSLWRVRCTACRAVYEDRAEESAGDLGPAPACARCGGLLRPDVVWFGEPLDPLLWTECVEACTACDVLLVAGTSAAVQPVASLALEAKSRGAVVAEINVEQTPQTRYMDFVLRGRAGEMLAALAPED
ncbi:MAG: NAD-dependent deacylase [Desulfovibrionaceae bacterium]|jgi:NAD-dependent deacetylase|nr:NAD-dependent deacylase [Desulfovibrionaceae bacterium]